MRNPRSLLGPAHRIESALALLGLVLCACHTPEQHLAAADREALAILEDKRAELGVTTRFDIAPSADSLRARLERGEASAPIDLVSTLGVAAENSRDYRRRVEDLYLAALDLTLERFRFEVQRNGNFGALLSRNGDGPQTLTAGLGGGFRRVLGTGADVIANVGLSLFHTVAGSGSDTVTSNFSLSILQPLMRGFGERIVKESLTQAERNVVYEVREFERFRRTFAFDVTSRYLDVLQQADTVANERVNMENLVVLRRRNEELAAAGRLSDIQVDQALQDELRSRNRLIQAEERLAALLDDYKFFLGLPILAPLELDPSELEDLVVDETLDVDETQAITVALERRLDIATALDQADDAERQVDIAIDNLRASVEVNASVAGESRDDRPLEYSKSGIDWRVGLDVDFPIDRIAERNAYRESLITLDRARRAAQQLTDQVQADLRDSLRQAQTRLETLRIQRGAVVLAERRVESTTLNLQAGRADTRDILEAQEALLEARNALTAARIDYHLSQLALWRDMELLSVDEDGLQLEREALRAPARNQP